MARRWIRYAAVVGLAITLLAGNAQATSQSPDINVVDLVREAEAIVTANVVSVTDGFGTNGMPYTEVTLEITENISGDLPQKYVFRQYGLTEKRLSEDGSMIFMPAPELFPRYAEGEQTLLFLYKPASLTGLQTTVALAHGKFTLGATRAHNALANEGVFRGVGIASELNTPQNTVLLDTMSGAVSSETLVSFVRRAVQENWISRGLMWKKSEAGKPGKQSPAVDVQDTERNAHFGSN